MKYFCTKNCNHKHQLVTAKVSDELSYCNIKTYLLLLLLHLLVTNFPSGTNKYFSSLQYLTSNSVCDTLAGKAIWGIIKTIHKFHAEGKRLVTSHNGYLQEPTHSTTFSPWWYPHYFFSLVVSTLLFLLGGIHTTFSPCCRCLHRLTGDYLVQGGVGGGGG